jgi:RimJ/RimL family protein N-acetyltransferase
LKKPILPAVPFGLQPHHLKNEIVSLVPLQEEHFEALYAVASDPLVWEQHPNPLRYQRSVFKTYFEGAIASGGAFLILDSQTGAVVGSSRFYDYNAQDSSILIGYTFIGRAYWGKGYNKEVKRLMLAYAFQYVDNVYFHIGAFNIRSQKAIENIGANKVAEIEVEYYGEDSKLNFIYMISKD